MVLAALILWFLTAVTGLYMLSTWIVHGGPRNNTSRFPVPVIFGHFLLAAAGLVIWVIYFINDAEALAWSAFGILVPVALLGFFMLARWLPTFQSRTTGNNAPAERHIPAPVVGGHGLLAVTTVILVLLTALGVGGS